MKSGRVVVLNGASSSGKTTLIDLFVEARASEGHVWIAVGIDDFIAKLPWRWLDVPGIVRGPHGADGIHFVEEGPGLVVKVGDLGRRLFATYRRVVAEWARQGFDVIVDEVAFDEDAARDWDEALDGLDVAWVGVRCDPDIAAEREKLRGDRAIGLARGESAIVHEHVRYDLELDTTTLEPAPLVAELLAFVDRSD